MLGGDEVTGKESFIEKEMKFARRWLYSKNIMVPMEAKNPVTTSLDTFFNECKTGGTPKAKLRNRSARLDVGDPVQYRDGRRAACELQRDAPDRSPRARC